MRTTAQPEVIDLGSQGREGLSGSSPWQMPKQMPTPTAPMPAIFAHGESRIAPSCGTVPDDCGTAAPHFSSRDFCSPSRTIVRVDCADSRTCGRLEDRELM